MKVKNGDFAAAMDAHAKRPRRPAPQAGGGPAVSSAEYRELLETYGLGKLHTEA